MPYEAPPIVKYKNDTIIIDIAWPQSENKEDIISLKDILQENNFSPELGNKILSIMISENYLSSESLEFFKKFSPSSVEYMM
jgi:hypothetical protein